MDSFLAVQLNIYTELEVTTKNHFSISIQIRMKNVFQISCERWTKASDLVSVEWIATRPDMKSRHHLTCGHHQNMRFVLHIFKSIRES